LSETPPLFRLYGNKPDKAEGGAAREHTEMYVTDAGPTDNAVWRRLWTVCRLFFENRIEKKEAKVMAERSVILQTERRNKG